MLFPGAQHFLEAREPQRFGELARPQPGYLQERPAQRCRRGAKRTRERAKSHALFAGLRQLARGTLDQRHRSGDFIGLAT